METDLAPLTCEAHPAESFTGFCPSCLRDRLHFLESTSAAATAHRNSISTTHRNSTSTTYPDSTASQLRRCKSFSYAAAASASNEIFAVDRRDRQFEKEVELRPIKDHAHPEYSQSKKPNFWKKLQNWRENKKTKKTKKKQQQEDLTAGESSRRFVEAQPEVSFDGFSRRSCDLGPRFSLDAGRIPFDEPRLSLDIRSVRSRFHAPVPAIQRSDGQIPVEEDLMVPGSSKQTKNYYYDSSSRSRRRSLDRSNSVKKFNIEMDEPKLVSSARVLPAVRSESFRHSSSDAFVDDPSDSFREKKSKKWSIWGLIHRQSTSSRGGGDNVDCLRVNEYNNGYNNGRVSRSNSNVSLRRSCDYGNGGFGSMKKKGLGLERNGSLRDNNGYHLFTRS